VINIVFYAAWTAKDDGANLHSLTSSSLPITYIPKEKGARSYEIRIGWRNVFGVDLNGCDVVRQPVVYRGDEVGVEDFFDCSFPSLPDFKSSGVILRARKGSRLQSPA
jgi:hypothetical protein